MFLFTFVYAVFFDLLILLHLDLDSDISDVLVLNERCSFFLKNYFINLIAFSVLSAFTIVLVYVL